MDKLFKAVEIYDRFGFSPVVRDRIPEDAVVLSYARGRFADATARAYFRSIFNPAPLDCSMQENPIASYNHVLFAGKNILCEIMSNNRTLAHSMQAAISEG